jgi:alpha-1,6-mannosyltransferase
VKIVDVNEFYAEQGGGVRTYVNQKLKAAAALGHELVVIAPGPEDAATERNGGRILWVKGPPMPFDPRYYVLYRERRVHELLDQERPDLIEGSSPWTGGWFAARYRGPGAKAFIYHQDPVAVYPQTFLDRWFSHEKIDEAFFPYWKYVRKLAQHYDATVVAGEWLAARLQSFGIPHAEAVPFGIDRSLFSPDNASADVKAELLSRCAVGAGGKLLVSISRYHPEKRLTVLLEAFDRVREHGEAGLVVFGDGPFRRWIERTAARIPGVHLAGYVSDRAFIAQAVASADVFLHGSAAETYGFVIAEAMASGTPIIAPDRGGAFDLVEPSFSETYPPGNVAACAAATLRLLSRDAAELSAAAVHTSQHKVRTTAEHFEGLFALYERLAMRAREAR